MVLAAAGPELTPMKEKDLTGLDVALVHYWMMTWRGGEKVVASLLKLFPKADVYTLFYDPKTCGKHLANHRVYTSKLNIPGLKKQYQKLFPFYPYGINSLKLQKKYDLIISSESGPAKGIANPNRIPHLCYIHTPMRYCWGFKDMYLESLPKWSRAVADKQFEKLRQWDLKTADKVDLYVANSQNVAERVKRFYGRSSRVCYPPIALDLFQDELDRRPGEFFLSFGALTPYKNIELLIDTFNHRKERLVVIGDGSEREKLMKKAKPNIEFLGTQPTPEVLSYIRRSRALLFPGEEDFGMIPLEVMSQGVPVIAYQKGGALETVVENAKDRSKSSGIFFREATVECLQDAINRFKEEETAFNPKWIRYHARTFGEDRFQNEMKLHILDLMNKQY